MKLKKVLVHASQALCAVIVLSCVVAGCGKREKKNTLPEVYPAENHGYMDDPVFKKQLEERDAERKVILGEREKLFAQFEALEKKAGSRAAAEKTPEWQALLKRSEECFRNFESNRTQTAALLRERAKRASEDSERIKRGEATAKKISK